MQAIIGGVLVFVGTYTGTGSKGIYVLRFTPATGVVRETAYTAEAANPSFLAINPTGTALYAVNETGKTGDQPSGAVSAFALDPQSGQLRFLNQQLSVGQSPCHISLDAAGTAAFVANYSSGTVSMLPILETGGLGPALSTSQHEGSGPNKSRQEAPHAHSITPDPKTGELYACDLGIDQIIVYATDAAGLKPVPPPLHTPPGSGPRHLAFHPNGKTLYVVNEINSTVTVFTRPDTATPFVPVQTLSTLPKGDTTPGTTCSDIHVAPSGRFVYAANRGHDSIAIFTVNEQDSTLTPVGHDSVLGRTPRSFALSPDGNWLLAANQDSDTINVFRIDDTTGRLQFSGNSISVPKPVCVRFMPSL